MYTQANETGPIDWEAFYKHMIQLSEHLTRLASGEVTIVLTGPWTNLTQWQARLEAWGAHQMDPMTAIRRYVEA